MLIIVSLNWYIGLYSKLSGRLVGWCYGSNVIAISVELKHSDWRWNHWILLYTRADVPLFLLDDIPIYFSLLPIRERSNIWRFFFWTILDILSPSYDLFNQPLPPCPPPYTLNRARGTVNYAFSATIKVIWRFDQTPSSLRRHMIFERSLIQGAGARAQCSFL